MARSRLRVYYGPEKGCATAAKPPAEENRVRVPLGEIFPLLADAVNSQRTWLRDFEDDEVRVSSDLYEVIASFTRLRPSA